VVDGCHSAATLLLAAARSSALSLASEGKFDRFKSGLSGDIIN
jgi:hypothetical protein